MLQLGGEHLCSVSSGHQQAVAGCEVPLSVFEASPGCGVPLGCELLLGYGACLEHTPDMKAPAASLGIPPGCEHALGFR